MKPISGRTILAILALTGACFGSAFNLTVEEWKDSVDSDPTTTWQPELVIDAWASGIRTMALAIFAYCNRNAKPEREKEEEDKEDKGDPP